MGKRSDFEHKPRNFYPTRDPRAVAALLPHLRKGMRFTEPCAGAGDLIDQLVAAGLVCVHACDIHPLRDDIATADASSMRLEWTMKDFEFITNPPFAREMLEPIMAHLLTMAPVWLLLPADYMHNLWFVPWLRKCSTIVSIGRLTWFPPDEHAKSSSGKENYAWYRFDKDVFGAIEFWPRG